MKSDTASPEFFSVDTVAGILRVDRKTVYVAIKTGTLKALRLGRAIRISAAAVAEFAGVDVGFVSGHLRRRAR